MTTYLKRHEIAKLIKASPKMNPVLEPVIAADDGYVLTADERIAFRIALGREPVALWRAETKPMGLGVAGITPHEAYALVSRIAALPGIESAALSLQRDSDRLRAALVAIMASVTTGKLPGNKDIVAASMVLRDTE